jgi:antitoxin component HigA of HigAB toxin-antitoxin module
MSSRPKRKGAHDREIEKLDARGPALTPEEENLAELMTLLVRQFEESKYPLGHAEPLDALRILMEDHGTRQRDLIPVSEAVPVPSASDNPAA